MLGLQACRSSLARFSTSPTTAAAVSVTTDDKGIATVSMNKAPVNSLNTEFILELTQAIVDTEKSAKAIVLTSGCKVFCAGLDITEMYQPEPARLRLFWGGLQQLWLALYGCRLPVTAAITGHSPAGGCLLAMAADYRVMLGPDYSIGLNETQLGIVAPFWFKDTMVNTIGTRQTELALMLGTLFTSQQALAIGLVDEVVEEREAVVAAAHRVAGRLAAIPPEARHVTKMLLRQPTLDRLASDTEGDIDHFSTFIQKPQIQTPMGRYLEALKSKGKKK
jgi:3,2-trans-enoyl-CoA isomerase